MGCIYCGRGLCKDCKKCKKGKCHAKETAVAEVEESSDKPTGKDRTSTGLKDKFSTGRKRAAKLYPIDPEAPCDWQGKKLCGGGKVPVIGCYDGKQQHRHHGPIKNPTRNHQGNVHRICASCHVHWHELNDLEYDEAEYALLPHEPLPATDQEIISNALAWKSGEMGRNFKLASSVKGGKLNVTD